MLQLRLRVCGDSPVRYRGSRRNISPLLAFSKPSSSDAGATILHRASRTPRQARTLSVEIGCGNRGDTRLHHAGRPFYVSWATIAGEPAYARFGQQHGGNIVHDFFKRETRTIAGRRHCHRQCARACPGSQGPAGRRRHNPRRRRNSPLSSFQIVTICDKRCRTGVIRGSWMPFQIPSTISRSTDVTTNIFDLIAELPTSKSFWRFRRADAARATATSRAPASRCHRILPAGSQLSMQSSRGKAGWLDE